jgi:hypothetical protein
MWLHGKPDEAKACLPTMEGVRWSMTKEEKTVNTKRKKATVSDPRGLSRSENANAPASSFGEASDPKAPHQPLVEG